MYKLFPNTTIEATNNQHLAHPLSWSSVGSLPSVRNSAMVAPIIINDRIYLFPGTIMSAPVSNPTTWTTHSDQGILDFSAVGVYGDYIYSFGGFNGSAVVTTIKRTSVYDPLTWSNVGNLSSALCGGQLVFTGGYAYLFGGAPTSTTRTAKIFSAPISNLEGGWSDTTATLPVACSNTSLAVIGDFIYIFGGWGVSGPISSIFAASLYSPTVWNNVGTLPAASSDPSLYIVGNKVFRCGGRPSVSGYTNKIYYAYLANPLVWMDSGCTIPANAGAGFPVIIDEYCYWFGGFNYQTMSAIDVIWKTPKRLSVKEYTSDYSGTTYYPDLLITPDGEITQKSTFQKLGYAPWINGNVMRDYNSI